MDCSLDDYLRHVVPHLSEALVDPPTLARIRHVARILPPTSVAGFETRLGNDQARLDFAVLFSIADESFHIVAGRDPGGQRSDPFYQTPAWQRLQTFCRHTLTPASVFYDNVDHFWLEFDAARELDHIPVPSIFFSLVPLNKSGLPDGAAQGAPAEAALEVASAALAILRGAPLEGRLLGQLARCFRLLPARASVFQVGSLLSRAVNAVRVCVMSMSVEATLAYLAGIGWPGAVDELAAHLADLSRVVDHIYLSLDVGEAVSPRVGLECCFSGPRVSQVNDRWEALFDYLVHKGCCTPRKREALLAWGGHELRPPCVSAPAQRRKGLARMIAPPKAALYLRGWNHVKVVHRPGRPLEAKAYFGFKREQVPAS